MADRREWRAALETGTEETWLAEIYLKDGHARLLINLDEPTARLIAAAPDMAEALLKLYGTPKGEEGEILVEYCGPALRKAGVIK